MSYRVLDGFLSVSCTLLLTLGWTLPTHAATALGENDYCGPPGVEIRQLVPPLDPPNINYFYDKSHVADNESISVVLAGNDVVVINVADGTIKVRATLTKVPISNTSNFYLRTEGGILYIANKVDRYNYDEQEITLRALDLATGGWLWDRTVIVTRKWKSVIGVGSASIAFHAGEIRVIFTDGQMARWRLSDLATLPTYYFNGDNYPAGDKDSIGPGPSTPIGVSFGDSFCAGISDNNDGLVMVNAGKSSIQYFPSGNTSYVSVASSSSYLVARHLIRAEDFRWKYDFLVWNLQKPNDAPISTISIPSATQMPRSNLKIWKNRFLLDATIDDESLTGETMLAVYDLASPGQAPLKIHLPAGLPNIVDMGIIGTDFWFLTDLQPATIGWVHGVADVTTLAAVQVDNAGGSEATGFLNFKVHVDGNFTNPVTVHLKSRSGSAKENVDYVSYDQTLTLTPGSPSTVVTIPILKDNELEMHESMILEVMEVNHAWRGNQFAYGTIYGGGISKIETVSNPPGSNIYFSFYNSAMTPEGIVAGVDEGKGVYRYYLKRLGGANWEEITSLTSAPSFFGGNIVAVRGNRVCATTFDENPITPLASKLVIADVAKNLRIATTPYDTHEAAMSDRTFVTLTQSGSIKGYDLASGNLIWSAYEKMTHSISALNDLSFITDGGRERLVVRSYADGSIIRSFPKALGKISAVSSADDRTTMFRESGLTVINNSSPDGHRYWMFPEPYNSGDGLISDGYVLLDNPTMKGSATKVLDCTTGAVLSEIAARNITKFGSEGGRFCLVAGTGMTIFQSRPVVPGPLQTKVTRREDEDPSTWKITLAETAAFPVTIRLLSGGDDIQATAPVTIPAGSLSAPFPARVVKDGIPEYEETIPLEILVSGNGNEGIYQINVTIPPNEYQVFPQLDGGNLLLGGSSMGAHPSGVVIGTTRGAAAVDPIQNKIYRSPKGLIGFGFAVACNELFIATSAVDLPALRGVSKPSGSKVFLYNRKSGKRVATLSETTAGTALGAVLYMDSERLIAGAPGKEIPGSVLVYDIKTKKSKTFVEPGAKDPKSRFGASITSSGNQIWIGAPLASTGKVYQFDGVTGKLVRVLTPPDGGRANFGTSLGIVDGKLMVGAPQLNIGAAVFSFDLNTGMFAGTINSPFKDGGNFGASLAVPRKDVLAVGCPNSLFAPEGGVALYQFSSNEAQLVTMLRSSNETNLTPQNGLGYFGGLGAVGGLAGVDSLLIAAVDIGRSPVDILNVPTPNYAHSQVGLISLVKYLPQISKPTQSVARLAVVVSKNPWERALGQGSTENNCRLELRSGVSGLSVLLPNIASIAEGTSLYLEKSSDLRHWTSIASRSGDSGVGWRLTSGEQVPAQNLMLPIPVDEQRAYYRIRCDAP